MAVRVFISHTGQYLAFEEQDTRLETLRAWIEEQTSIPGSRQILMTARGKNIKNLINETEVFVYDKHNLSHEAEVPSSSPEMVPDLRQFPTAVSDNDSLGAWQDLLKEQRAWAQESLESIRIAAEKTDNLALETDVISRSISAALENLKTFTNNLNQKFEATKKWASDHFQDHTEVLNDWESSANILAELPVREDVAVILHGHSEKRSSSQIGTLQDLLDMPSLRNAESSVKTASSEFNRQFKDLEASMSKVKDNTIDVERHAAPLPDADVTPLIEEAETVAKRIGNNYEDALRLVDEPRSVSAASRKASTHSRELLPAIQGIMADLQQMYTACQKTKSTAIGHCFAALKEISGIQSQLSSVQREVTGLEFKDEQSLRMLSRIFQLPSIYGFTLIEAVRRSEWTQKMQTDVDSLHDDLSQLTEEEQRRRRKWAISYSDFLSDELNATETLIDLRASKPRNTWPFVSRDEIFAWIDDLRALNIDEAVHAITQKLKELDSAVRRPKRTFKNGSVQDLASSSILRNGDDARLLQEEKTRLEEKLRASDSRVRKLEDLLHRQSQLSRPSSTTFTPGSASDFERQTPSPMPFPKQSEISKRPSVSLRRLSNTGDEKAMVQRIVSLEGQIQKLQDEAHAERRSSTESRDKMQEAESVKQDLMANFDAQRQEFEDERQLMDDDNHKLKIRIEELEDELDRVLGSRDHLKLTQEQNLTSLRNDLEQLKKVSADERVKVESQSESLRRDIAAQKDRASALERQLNQCREERNAAQYQNMSLANQLRSHEEQQQDFVVSLQSAHSNLSPAGSAPEDMRRLVNALEVLSEGAAIHARGLDDSLQLATAENKSLEERVNHSDTQIKQLKDKLSSAENKQSSISEALEHEKIIVKAVRGELSDGQNELSNLRAKLAAGETGSDALRDRLADEEQKVAELHKLKIENETSIQRLKSEIDTLTKEAKSSGSHIESLRRKLQSRGDKAKQLSERLFQHNDRIVRMLEQFGYSISREDEALVIQRASKVSASLTLSTIEGPTAMKRTISGGPPPQHYSDPSDLDTLYWTSDTETTDEDTKYQGFISALQRLDLDSTMDLVIKRYKDVESIAKKYQKDSRAYREKSHRLQSEARDKIAFRSFKEGDLALFLPTRNQATKPWAAFNVGAPHYFLREQDSHSLHQRDWLLARISKIDERQVDLSRSMSASNRANASDAASFDDENPFELSDGLRWYLIEASEEKAGAPGTPSIGKASVIASNIDVKAQMGRKDKGTSNSAGNAAQVTKTLNRSLESRRSSSASKRSGSLRKGDGSSLKDAPAPLAPIVSEVPDQGESSTVKPSDADAGPGRPAREDAQVFEVVRRDLLLGP
jgi:autophagy-related protein 11